MKTLVAFLTIILIILPMQLAAEDTDHGEKKIKVQAWDFSDPDLDAAKGVPCGEFLAFLMGPEEKYKIIDTAGVQGPPGVMYTLDNYKGEIAILKCGTAGGCSHEEGGGDH